MWLSVEGQVRSAGAMGKIDDMRRLREEQHAARAKGASAKKTPAVDAEPASPSSEKAPAQKTPRVAAEKAPRAEATKASSEKDETGECASCGKRKALQNGLIAQHQKGFGKMCPGSRKAPV